MKKLQAIRWTLESASAEFAIDRKTLTKRIKSGGIEVGEDGRFSTLDICKAVYGDYDGEKLRDKRLDADLKEIEKAEKLRELIPAANVERSWEAVLVGLRQKIVLADIPDALKEDVLNDLQSIPVNDYFTSTNPQAEEDSEEESSAA